MLKTVYAAVARPQAALVLTLLLFSMVVVLSQGDMLASDPLWYADIGYGWLKHPADVFQDHHPFVMRVGLTVPLALIYWALGVSTFSTNLISLLSAVGIIVVAYAAAPTPRAKLFALLFSVTCLALLRHAILLNVDLPCAALLGASVLCLSRRAHQRGVWWVIAGMAAWFMSFLVKETALWCAPIWVYAFAMDVRETSFHAASRRFAPSILFGAVLGVLYLAACARLWGSPWARFQGIEELTYEHAWTLQGHPVRDWANRLTWQPVVMLARMFHVALIPVALSTWFVPKPHRIWIFATATFGLLYWFGSASLSSYTPLPLSQRMALSVLPPLLVVAAIASDAAVDRLRTFRFRRPLYACLALILVLPAIKVMAIQIRRARPETVAFQAVKNRVLGKQENFALVCGEPRCVSIAGFYFGFEIPPNLSVTFAADFGRDPQPTQSKVLVLVNIPRATGAGRTDPALNRTREIEALRLPSIVSDRGVRLYDAGDGSQLWQALHATN